MMKYVYVPHDLREVFAKEVLSHCEVGEEVDVKSNIFSTTKNGDKFIIENCKEAILSQTICFSPKMFSEFKESVINENAKSIKKVDKKRKYLLKYCTKSSLVNEINFESKFKANSKGNIEDAKKEMELKLGEIFEIKQVCLVKKII